MRASNPRRPTQLLLLALALLLTGAACGQDGGESDERPIGSITGVSGAVDLVSSGAPATAEGGTQLRPGDALAVGEGGRVEFELGGAASYVLSRGRAELAGADDLVLRDAVLVVEGDGGVETDLGPVQLAFSSGIVRADVGETGRVAAYEVADLQVTAGSQQVPLPRLWQLSVTPEGGLDDARPLQFSRDDPIDAENLQHALDADAKLGNLLRGLEPQLAAAPPSAVPDRLTGAGLPAAVVAALAPVPRSDQLMGLAFARAWNNPELVRSYEQAMALRVLGATWGLVAQNFAVGADALVGALQAEINAVLFPPGSEPGQLVPSPSPAVRRPQGTARPQPAAPPAPAPPVGPAPPPPGPAPVPSPTGSPGLIGPVVDPLRPLLPDELERIIDDLLGVVDGLVPIV